jgi:uncharacterized protein YdaU (DUF1376 family)
MEGVSMSKSPAFQFYPSDFLGSGKVGTMTVDEIGAYTLLLCLDWNENGFVFDEEELARWCKVSRAKFRKLWVRVSRCFDEKDGRMYNARLQIEREKQAEWREKSARGGKASAEAKAKGSPTTLQPPLQPNANTLSSSSSSTPVTAKGSTARPAAPRSSVGFDRAWALYPKRGGSNSRTDAFKSWCARQSQGVQESELLAGTERYKAWCEATAKVGTELVMQGKRFYGPSGHFLEAWEVSAGGGDAPSDAAWQSVLAMVPAWHRREVTPEVYAELPEPVKRGLSAIGGLRILADTPDQVRAGLQKKFAAACHSTRGAA